MFPRKIARLDLFSGISLGLHWFGIQTVALCKAEPCSRATLRASGMPRPDVLCGGFPCRDISLVGCGAGLAGARLGLWSHMARLVAKWDRVGWWLKNSLVCEAGARTGCWLTWRRSVTPGVHAWWVLPIPARPIAGHECGSWPKPYFSVSMARDWKVESVAQRNRRRSC